MSSFYISTVKADLDVPLIHRFLTEQSTWAKGIPLATVERAIDNSLCFGGFLGPSQIAFARVISDFATFGNLVDVFVLPEHRGNGFSRFVMQAVMSHPQLQDLRRFTLTTSNTHGLYAQFGFVSLLRPESYMERYIPSLYDTGL